MIGWRTTRRPKPTKRAHSPRTAIVMCGYAGRTRRHFRTVQPGRSVLPTPGRRPRSSLVGARSAVGAPRAFAPRRAWVRSRSDCRPAPTANRLTRPCAGQSSRRACHRGEESPDRHRSPRMKPNFGCPVILTVAAGGLRSSANADSSLKGSTGGVNQIESGRCVTGTEAKVDHPIEIALRLARRAARWHDRTNGSPSGAA